MTLRLRLTLLVAAVVAGAIVVAAGASYVLTSRQLTSEMDAFLLQRAASMSPRSDPFGSFSRGPRGVLEPDAVVQLLSEGGSVSFVLQGNPRLPVGDRDVELSRQPGPPYLRDVEVDGQRYRMATASVVGGGAVQIARSLAETDAVLAGLRLRMLLVLVGGTGLGAAIGSMVAGRIVGPVERLTGAAERVATTADLTTPVPQEGDDEVGRLAASFNVMLDALDASKRKQRSLIEDASHELRTPLTSLRTNIELLQRADGIDPAERRALIDDAVSELSELTVLVSELVELATDQEVDAAPEVMTLAEASRRAIERVGRRTDRAIELSVDEPVEVEARAGMVERAIGNLIGNALKFAPASEPIEVCVEGARVTVHDAGPGIAEDERERVFDRFYRATAARSMPGSGLGLSIVKQTVEAHGGTVHAGVSARGGAAVGFELPARGAPPLS